MGCAVRGFARRAVLTHLGEHGPSTARQIAPSLPPKSRIGAAVTLANACDDGLVTRAGYQGRQIVWALTPKGLAWLEADEAGLHRAPERLSA